MKNKPLWIALFEPDIPQNAGSLIRLAACLGVKLHIIGPCGFPLDNKKLKRVAMDYGSVDDITLHASWQAFLDFRQMHAGGRLLLLTTKAACAYTEFIYQPGDILLLGRESAGVPDRIRQVAGASLLIPMQPGARSLNVAQAASMVLGEALRQTKGFYHGHE